MIVLDTNVLSELLRPVPDRQVLDWASRHAAGTFCITAITQAELLYGLALLPKSRRKAQLTTAVQDLIEQDFAGRILPFDEQAAIRYAEIASRRRTGGRPISQFDAQIAAIACSNGASLATRNTKDFADCGVPLIDPWTEK